MKNTGRSRLGFVILLPLLFVLIRIIDNLRGSIAHRPHHFAVFVAILFSHSLYGNNISINNITFLNQDVNADKVTVQFDLNWENSWSDGNTQWDAAWVFIKFMNSSGNWEHAKCDTANNSVSNGQIRLGLVTPASPYSALNPAIGAFVYRSGAGSGGFATQVNLRWIYGTSVPDNAISNIRVYGIEMVYVSQGSFVVGDGTASIGQAGQLRGVGSSAPYTMPIDDSSFITMGGSTPTNLSASAGMTTADDFNATTTQTLSATFPKGVNAFYSMKYEISQQGYVDFLNTLTRAQQTNRVGTAIAAGTTSVTNRYVMSNTSAVNSRNGIGCDAVIHASNPINFYCDLNGNGNGGQVDDGQCIACNYLNFADLKAYLDWCGLRPMTELEFEKLCRGSLSAVAGEFAWGTIGIGAAANITNPGKADEICGTVGANAVCSNNANVSGPMRVGVMAGPTTNRAQAGGSYYGAMDLSGNLIEQIISIGTSSGRTFSGNHGNGNLNLSGNADVTQWPNVGGQRGGSWAATTSKLRLSDRSDANVTISSRGSTAGGRGVRRAP